MTNIKKLADRLRNAIAIENLAYDTAFESEETTPAMEAEWEQCNNYTNKLREELAAEIEKITSGCIDNKTAWTMTFKPETFDLIAKLS